MSRRFVPQEVTAEFRDRAVLVGLDLGRGEWPIEESLAELGRLAETAGAQVVATLSQRLDRPNPRTFIGAGKAEEVAEAAQCEDATLVLFDDDLTPSQQANVEALLPGVKVLDRTALILDIFALHATSMEGKLQVELAQMEYLLPRLRGLWRHFEQAAAAAGGKRGIGTRGPGETQLETDRRLARRRIAHVRRELKRVGAERDLQRSARRGSGVFRVALVGYTNAGKSTLLNALTGAGAFTMDLLFATLDSTTRRYELPEGREVTLTDTVGFIHKLPHGLVESFKSTLDEVREADLLLHVVDASHPQVKAHMHAVREVLGELGAAARPLVLVFNKTDLADPGAVAALQRRHPDALFISAVTGDGIAGLVTRIADEAARGSIRVEAVVPYTRGDLVMLAHERTQILTEEHTPDGTRLVLRAPAGVAERFSEFAVGAGEADAVNDPDA
ncbi:MAG: GTPase HflX [Actinobacteria bacterium]|nr:MAG: GTPase HflX [Actinomycetota bacterium]